MGEEYVNTPLTAWNHANILSYRRHGHLRRSVQAGEVQGRKRYYPESTVVGRVIVPWLDIGAIVPG